MSSYLSAYRNFIDISTKEGQTLLSNATDKFKSPLQGHDKISLRSTGNEYQKFKDNITCCSLRFGYQGLLNSVLLNLVATRRTVIPAISEIIADPTVVPPIIGVPAIPEEIIYSSEIKLLEVYLDKLLEITQKHALLTWGDQSFTNHNPKVIRELNLGDGHLTVAGRLTVIGKAIIQEQINSKILAHQAIAMLSDEARQVIKRQSNLFVWKDENSTDEEMDGLTIIALILWHLCPHHKVDMYAEIGKIKKLTVAHVNNDIHLFFDAMKSIKLQIDQKDPMAYTDDAFVRDIFIQLKDEALPFEFKNEFTSLEWRWQMDKEIVTSQLLMDAAGTYFTNLVAFGSWKAEVSKHAQIIALTTQISELKNKFSKVKIAAKPNEKTLTSGTDDTSQAKQWGNFELWRLTKVINGAEFNTVKKDGKKLYWCDQHQYPGNATKGMYVFHKPTDHDLWAAKKASYKK
jgi:hypothetical protein